MKALNTHARASEVMIRTAGLLTGLVSFLVITGWITHNRALVQVFTNHEPMWFNTALCFLGCSTALLMLDTRFQKTAGILSATVFLFVLIILQQYIFDFNSGIDTFFVTPFTRTNANFLGRMAPNTAVASLCTSSVLFFCSRVRAWDQRKLFGIALLGSLIVAQGLIPLLGYLFGLETAYEWGIFTAMVVQSALNFVLLGVGIIAFAWKKSDGVPLWLPVPVCIGLVVASFSVAAAVRSYEEIKFEDALQLKAQNVAHDAEIYLTGLYSALDRIKGRWVASGGTPRPLWESDVKAYLKDYPLLRGLSWINAKSEVTWVMPMTLSNKKVIGFNLSSEPRRAAAIAKAFATHESQTTRQVAFLSGGGKGFLYVCPLYIGDRYDGLTVAAITTEALFNKIIDDADHQPFYFTIREENEVIWSTLHDQQPEARFQKSATFHNKSYDWLITVSPKAQYALLQSSPFSDAVLGMGIVASLLITWSLSATLNSQYSAQILRQREALLEEALGKLYTSERIKQAIFDSSQYFIISSNTDGIIHTFNRYASEMLGYSPKEIIGKLTPKVFHVEEEIVERAKELSLELGEIIKPGYGVLVTKAARGYSDENEWTFVRKDGSHFRVLLTVTALRDENLAITGYLGIAKDITRAKEIEEALRKSEENFRSSFENATIGMSIVSTEGKWLKVNKALCAIIGYTPDELLAIDFQTITHPEDLDADIKLVQKMLRREISTYQMEKRYMHKKGHYVWTLLSVSLVLSSEDKPLHFISQIQDITQRKGMERMKNEFVSTVSHELRTPLTSIRGSLGLMRAGVVGEMPPKAKEMTEIAYNNAERLIMLINDILDIDKIESGQMRFDMKEHELGDLIKHAVEANQAYGEKFNVRFAIEPLDTQAFVFVDSNRLIQVLSNLLSNAAKFSPAGDEVSIRLARHGRKIRVNVIDHGQGIPEEFRARIFSKFAQADSSSSRQKSGTGLGLNISKQIIEHMQGKIGFTSQEGEGSTFWIELSELIKQTSPELHDAIEYLDADNRNFLPYVLHAEDDYGFCRIIAQSLQDKAIVHAAPTVADAARLLKSHTYDLLVLDLSLPDGTGLRLLDQIEQGGYATKTIILSASEVNETIQRRVAMALVKSKVSEKKAVEYIIEIIQGNTSMPGKEKS